MCPRKEIDMEYVYNQIVKNGKTIRQVAKECKISKSYLHIRIHDDMPAISFEKHREIIKALKINFNERSIRGGMSTKRRFERIKAMKR